MAWDDAQHDAVVKWLAVVCEVTATEYSDAARTMILRELQEYSAQSVMDSLRACSRECKGKLSLADIVSRIDKVDRKALSDAYAARQHEETQLRICALRECIAWDASDMDGVRRQLNAKGYRFKLREREEKLRALPHWSENEAGE